MRKILLISCFLLSGQVWASGFERQCWDTAGNLMMDWEGVPLRPFGKQVRITPLHYKTYDEILSGTLDLVEKSKPGEPARYVLEGTVQQDEYRATILTATGLGVVADLTNLMTGELVHLSCK